MNSQQIFKYSEDFLEEIIEDLILETIKSISKKEVSFIINTHFHYDHVDGNKDFEKNINK